MDGGCVPVGFTVGRNPVPSGRVCDNGDVAAMDDLVDVVVTDDGAIDDDAVNIVVAAGTAVNIVVAAGTAADVDGYTANGAGNGAGIGTGAGVDDDSCCGSVLISTAGCTTFDTFCNTNLEVICIGVIGNGCNSIV